MATLEGFFRLYGHNLKKVNISDTEYFRSNYANSTIRSVPMLTTGSLIFLVKGGAYD